MATFLDVVVIGLLVVVFILAVGSLTVLALNLVAQLLRRRRG